MIAYLIGRTLPFIPNELSILPRLKNKGYLTGLIDGAGNVRNLSASVIAGAATIGTHHLLSSNRTCNDEKAYKNNELKICSYDLIDNISKNDKQTYVFKIKNRRETIEQNHQLCK